jgi:hypothetical protein
MTPALWLSLLGGDADAIRQIAASRWSLAIGAILVLSAALARSHHRHDISRKPAVLLIPFGASLAAAYALCVLLVLTTGRRDFLSAWPVWIALFWGTAPLAWLYGLPVECWTTPLGAIKARFLSLALVSVARVAITIRAVDVLTQCGGPAAFFEVMLFADLFLLAALWCARPRSHEKPPQLFTGMGAMSPRAPRDVRWLRSISWKIAVAAILTFPLWLLGVFITSGASANWSVPQMLAGQPPAAATWGVALGAVVAWSLLSLAPQRWLRRAGMIERLVDAGDYARAAELLSTSRPRDFPPLWMPPPAGRFSGAGTQRFLGMLAAISVRPSPPWVRLAYDQQFAEFLQEAMWWWLDDATFNELMQLIEKRPDRPLAAALAVLALDRLIAQGSRLAFPERILSQLPEELYAQSHFGITGKYVWSDPEWPNDTPERQAQVQRLREWAATSQPEA